MSRYTYAGPFKNPTEGWTVEQYADDHPEHAGKYYVAIPVFCDCGSECCDRRQLGTRPHTRYDAFDEYEDAIECIEDTEQFFEEDYDQYLEENSHEIARMEAWEDFKNEY